jgi:hypothetical protein
MELSIVVVCVSRPETRERCLAALLAQAVPAGAEVLVVRRPATGPGGPASEGMAWIEAPADDTVPRMRARGIRAARGRVVALLEDDCAVAGGWCAAVLAAHRKDALVVGGPIEPDLYDRGLDWAVFFCEYARFLPPLDGEVATLPGNNVSYRGALVREWLEGRDGFVEAFAHQDWRARVIPLLAAGGMQVRSVNRWTPATATRSAFHHGRAFAGQRFQGKGALRWRLLYATASPLLPALKTARVAREVLTRGRGAGSLLRGLPWIIVFHTSWAIGELLGYLRGPGRSADRWQ